MEVTAMAQTCEGYVKFMDGVRRRVLAEAKRDGMTRRQQWFLLRTLGTIFRTGGWPAGTPLVTAKTAGALLTRLKNEEFRLEFSSALKKFIENALGGSRDEYS